MTKSISSASPRFWNQRYASGQTPWLVHSVPAALRAFLKRTKTRGAVLIPGCGTDHLALQTFQTAGFDVTAIDFSKVAVARTKNALGHFEGEIVLGDFFTFDFGKRFDLIYERTFLCALHPRRWRRYAARVAELLRSRAILAGIFLYGEEPDPPPYPLSKSTAAEIFGKYFRLVHHVKISDSVPMFAGMESWQEWQRASHGERQGSGQKISRTGSKISAKRR
ncbi:MAG: SAM-dependent methyltransferase [Verrucomicrobia bacterium]|nr:MAG: SAM-dependent methyltransferase [Verrucomicrobiota bacterium]